MTLTEQIWSYNFDEDALIEKSKKQLEQGLDFNQPEYDSKSPIQAAVRMRYPKLLQFYVDTIVKIHSEPLFDAIRYGYLEELKILLSAEIDLGWNENYRLTAIEMVAMNGTLEMFNLIYDKGVSIDPRELDPYNSPLLKIANSLDIVKRLIQLGLDVDEPDSDKITPLANHVRDDEKLDIVSCLLDAGADINSQDIWKQTPLFIAIREHNIEAAKMLISRGADKSIPDIAGTLPIDLAVHHNFRELIELLN